MAIYYPWKDMTITWLTLQLQIAKALVIMLSIATATRSYVDLASYFTETVSKFT